MALSGALAHVLAMVSVFQRFDVLQSSHLRLIIGKALEDSYMPALFTRMSSFL
jgi:hypothetical protein